MNSNNNTSATMQLFSDVSPRAWTFGPMQTSQNRKGIPIVDEKNQHVEVKLCENSRPLRIPFQPSNFEKDDSKTRLSCVLILDQGQIQWIEEIEKWARDAVAERAADLDWTPEQTVSYFKSAMKVNEKYGVTQFSVKMNTSGRFRVKFWDQNMAPMEDELMDLEEKYVVPIVKLRGIWVQPGTKMWGLSWDMTHCMIQPRSLACPFENLGDKENDETNAPI